MPEISRILAPDGVFIAVTHSKNTLREAIQFISSCMTKIGVKKQKEAIINKLFMAFSLEDGKAQLEKYFNRVEQLDFKNSMIFSHEHINDLIFYIQKKKHLIYKEVMDLMPKKLDDVQHCVETSIIEYSKIHGSMTINKDDAVFRCYEPKN
jgi:hypothetical protein